MTSRQIVWARIIFAILLMLITVLTLIPNPEDVGGGFDAARWLAALLFGNPEFGDKIAHFGAYGLLGASAFAAQLRFSGSTTPIPFFLGAYGALLEGAQRLGGAREADWLDAAANGIGAVSGYLFALAIGASISAYAKAS